MKNIYEEIYQHLIDQGIEDEVATNFVNEMYDKEKYHDVEVLNEGVLRGLGAAARFLSRLSKTRVGKAGMFGTGAAGLGYAGYLADKPEKKPEVAKAKPAPKTRDASEPDTAPATPKDNTVADKKQPSYYDRLRTSYAKNPSSLGKSMSDFNVQLKGKVSKDLRPEVFKNKEEPKKETKKVEKPFDIRDRDVTARASYDPRLKSERERMKRIRAERKARKDKNRTSS